MVTETAPFADSGLPPVASLVFGGHDTLDCPLPKRAEALAAGGVLPHGLPSAVRSELAAADAEIRMGGPLPGDTRSDEELIAAFAADLTDFGSRNHLARTVVVNVSSTEPAPDPDATRLPASSLYAAAALRAAVRTSTSPPPPGCARPPSRAPSRPRDFPTRAATARRARRCCAPCSPRCSSSAPCPYAPGPAPTCWAAVTGRRSPTRPPRPRRTCGKERVLADTLGAAPEGEVHIDDVPALGDWKTAWDHIAFDGFLGARMVLQTTWQGCDSALAAPLVLDLARLLARAHEVGLSGPRPELGFYFKDPDGGPAALSEQYLALLAFAEQLRGER